MTNYPYIAPCSYFLVRSYEIPGSVDHVGILKVGDTTIKSLKKASELTVNSKLYFERQEDLACRRDNGVCHTS